jgi:hypothetical protein
MTKTINRLISTQGFQSGPVPGTFTRLRSCIVPAEITEPPKISGGQVSETFLFAYGETPCSVNRRLVTKRKIHVGND